MERKSNIKIKENKWEDMKDGGKDETRPPKGF